MIYDNLKTDMIKAMKEKNKEILTTIRTVKASMDLEHIDKKRELNDDLALDVINKEIKTRKESLEQFIKANRLDLANKTKQEIEILQKYLPKQLTKEELDKELNNIFKEIKPTSIKDMGKIMKEVNAKLKGKADISVVSSKVKEMLNKLN